MANVLPISRPPQTLLLPRGLILLASLWLIVSWKIAIGVQAPVEVSSASYTPGVRLMLMCVVIGLLIAWPLLRLSQPATAFPIRQTLLDLVVLLALVQVVIWPLRLITPWSAVRTAAIAASLIGWTTLAGAVVASAVGSPRAGPRNLAILACLTMCLAGPTIAWLRLVIGLGPGRLVSFGPPLEIYDLTGGGGAPPAGERWLWLVVLGLASLASWLGLSVATHLKNRRSRVQHRLDEL